jgi:hypothetical protein
LHLEKQFDVACSRDAAVEVVARDETLLGLFPEARTEIVAREGDCTTVRSHYRALGRDGTATFHFTFLLDGDVRFEKVCDGRMWRALTGSLRFEERGGKTRVRIEMDGQTRPFVPEFTVRGAMQEQLDRMASALRDRIENA